MADIDIIQGRKKKADNANTPNKKSKLSRSQTATETEKDEKKQISDRQALAVEFPHLYKGFTGYEKEFRNTHEEHQHESSHFLEFHYTKTKNKSAFIYFSSLFYTKTDVSKKIQFTNIYFSTFFYAFLFSRVESESTSFNLRSKIMRQHQFSSELIQLRKMMTKTNEIFEKLAKKTASANALKEWNQIIEKYDKIQTNFQ